MLRKPLHVDELVGFDRSEVRFLNEVNTVVVKRLEWTNITIDVEERLPTKKEVGVILVWVGQVLKKAM